MFIIKFKLMFMFILDDLNISETDGSLEANSIWGILRGIESFSQLLYNSPDGRLVI